MCASPGLRTRPSLPVSPAGGAAAPASRYCPQHTSRQIQTGAERQHHHAGSSRRAQQQQHAAAQRETVIRRCVPLNHASRMPQHTTCCCHASAQSGAPLLQARTTSVLSCVCGVCMHCAVASALQTCCWSCRSARRPARRCSEQQQRQRASTCQTRTTSRCGSACGRTHGAGKRRWAGSCRWVGRACAQRHSGQVCCYACHTAGGLAVRPGIVGRCADHAFKHSGHTSCSSLACGLVR